MFERFLGACVLVCMSMAAPAAAQFAEVLSDQDANTPVIVVAASGSVKDTTGRPIPGVIVEMSVNPYKPTEASSKVSTTTDESGQYLLLGQGHHGAVRLVATLGGYVIGARTAGSVRKDQRLKFNWRVQVDRDGNIRIPAVAPYEAYSSNAR